MIARCIAASGLALLLISVSGCGVNAETLEALQSAVSTVSSAQSQAVAEEASPRQAAAALEEQFQPTHPNREDPFTFPAGAQVSDGESSSLTTVAEIEILGFAKVGEQHVLLRSGEKSRSLTVGESIDRVRVIEINPPTVRLQMGTLIWTATMFDKADGE